MSLSINIKDNASPLLKELEGRIVGEDAMKVMGRAGVNSVREYLFALNRNRPNKLGGRRTNFFSQAARGTQFQVRRPDVIIGINQVGIRQRYQGGTIRATKSKFLTIPVNPNTHGKRAREFKNLVPAVSGDKGVLMRRPRRGSKFGEVMFLLVRSVNQKPDPTVLPPQDALFNDIARETKKFLIRRGK